MWADMCVNMRTDMCHAPVENIAEKVAAAWPYNVAVAETIKPAERCITQALLACRATISAISAFSAIATVPFLFKMNVRILRVVVVAMEQMRTATGPPDLADAHVRVYMLALIALSSNLSNGTR